MLSLGTSAPAQGPPGRAFDRARWEADYAALKNALERNYAHLAWMGSPQSGVDLPALDRNTLEKLSRSQNDAEASAAILGFVAGFHDGHFALTPARTASSSEPPVTLTARDARTACAAFGFAPVTRIAFSLPFETLPGFELVADGLGEAFRSGVIEVSGKRIGIVRIPRFRAAEFPAVCESVWRRVRAQHQNPSRSAVLERADVEWLRILASRLSELRKRRVATVLVDVGGNGGGNDLGDWAVRLFTERPVHSAALLLTRGPAGVPYLDEQLGELKRAESIPALPRRTRSALQDAWQNFQRLKDSSRSEPCDMSWIWREQRAWGTLGCNGLMAAGFLSGALDYVPPDSLDSRVKPALYWASRADPFRGAWNGPTYLLTNGGTGSAAEMFTALIRDRGVAKTIGTRTAGLGCGFMDYEEPFVLPYSRLAFNIPNCVRLRGDGSDEVAGIVPDLPVSQGPGETPRSVAWRVLVRLSEDLVVSH